jgi:hypothetical protein
VLQAQDGVVSSCRVLLVSLVSNVRMGHQRLEGVGTRAPRRSVFLLDRRRKRLMKACRPVLSRGLAGCSIAAMTSYLTAFVLIGGLVVLGLLVGVGLVLLTVLRERADVGATRDEAVKGADQDRAA